MTADGEHQLTPEQREAIDSRDRDVFLRAGAGTGKTTVLVDRFCAAALDPDVGVDRILAFTFTERAADQLRRRVRERFAQLGREAEGERRERIEEAERAADRAWISTIHGFCRRVLASHPAAAGIDPRFRVADQVESDRLAGRAFDAALEDLVQAGGAEALELAAANRRRTLLEMTRGAYDELRSQGHPAPELPEPPPVDHAASLSALIETAGLAHEECAEAGPQQVSQRELIAAASALDPEAPADAELLDRLASLKITTTAKEFKGEACERYREALLAARSAVAATVLGPAYEQLRELVRRFGECYEALKADRSALDFEDLQLRARELLSSNEALRDRYREQFRHLMVDEFQDTNGLQLGLIEQLRGPQTRLFMVGDEFQSIYGFRHADVEVYRRQQRRFAQGEEPNGVALPLTGNFRSSGEVLAMTNALGRSLLAGFEPLTVAGEEAGAEGPAVELLLTAEDKKGWEAEETELKLLPDDPSSASKVAEARRLAGRLRELVDEGEDPSEIVVLLRAFTHVTTLERALGDAGLDPYVVGGRGFWSQQQVEDMRCLLAVIANPLDDQALFGALASPACAVLPDTLWLLRGAATEEREDGRRSNRHVWPLLRDLAEHGEAQRGDTDAAAMIPPGELQRLREFAEQIGTLRQRGAEDGLESLVERTAVALQYDIATLVRDSGEARWANVRKLMRLAREFETREGPDLAAFLEYLVSRAASSDREAEAATRAEGHAGVRVMTVHSAKGLEFGVVAVADLGRRPQLGWTPLRLGRTEETPDDGEAARVGVQLGRLGRPGERLHGYAELTELAADREAEEEGRLAYVAATRAERRLLLSGTVNPNAKQSDKPNRQPIATQLLAKVLEGDPSSREMQLEAAGEGFPAGRLAVSLSSPGPGVGARLLRETETPPAEAPSEDREPPLKRPHAVAAPAGALSYSALSDYESCGYRYYVKRVLGLTGAEGGVAVGAVGARDDEDRASPTEKRRYGPGLAVHSLLEWSAQHRWAAPGAERTATALREQGLPAGEQEVERARELVRGWLDSGLREELAPASISPELPFVLTLGNNPIGGTIDLLAERGDGSVLVVDYKTDRLEGREPAQAAARYRVQRELYALAASGRGAPVETAYVFLERPEQTVRHTFEQADLDAARERIEGLLGRLGEGEFEVTHHPHKALCHDCPARERLCSHEIGAQMRDDPDPPIVPIPRSERPRPEPAEGAEAEGGAQPQTSLLD